MSCAAWGSRVMLTALKRKTTEVKTGITISSVRDSGPSAMMPSSEPSVKPTLSAEYMYARDVTRSCGGSTSIVYAPCATPPRAPITSMATAIAT